MQPPLCVRDAICTATSALKDKKQKPKIYRCCNIKKTEDLVVSSELKKMDNDPAGRFRFRWPHLDLSYTLKENSEDVRIQLEGHEEVVTLLYVEQALASMTCAGERFDAEHFQMRQSGNIADQLRCCLRHHLRLSGGTLEHEKFEEPTFTPKLDLNKAGEIKLKDLPVTWAKPKSKPEE